MMNFNFNNPTNILFGRGMLNELGKQQLPGKGCALISSGKSTRVNGYLDRTLEQLKIAGVDYVIYDKITENPLKEHCEEGGKFARENACDFIVALGGGAVLDSSKMVSSMATNDGDLWEYAKGKAFQNAGLPIVTIPTTSGTGSEVNCSALSPTLQHKRKSVLVMRGMFPFWLSSILN